MQIVWRGIVHDYQGYARASREYLLALDRAGVDIKIEPLNFGTPSSDLLPDQARRIRELIAKPLSTGKKVLIYHAQPYGVDADVEREKGFDKVIINTVWETTEVPRDWFPFINKADAVMVPSNMNVKSLVDSGVEVPIYMIPHGVDSQLVDAKPLEISGTEKTFNFLSVFQWQNRKAPEVLLNAFWQEFTSKDKVSLVLKTYWGNNGIKAHQRQVRDTIISYKNAIGYTDTAPIYFTGSLFSETDMHSLYNSADIFVLPSRGEGVGLPYLESMNFGVPCIATGWGGQTDFINDDNGYLIDYKLVSTHDSKDGAISQNFYHLFTEDMKWAEANVSHLRKIMRHVYENQDEVKAKGLKAKESVSSQTWDNSGLMIKKMVEEVAGCQS